MNRAMRLGTAAVKSEGARFCSSFRRSGSTFTAAAAAAVDNSHRPSIYLCFEESTESTNYVVRRLGLNHGGDDAPSELTVEAYMKFEHVTARYQNRNCTMLGSQIIIPACYSNQGCREICWTDTAKTPMKFQVSSEVSFRSIDELKHQIKIGDVKYISLPTPMPEVTIGVIGGELYCLDLYNKQLFKMYPSMNEVLDPYFNRFVSLPSRSRLVSTCHEEVADYRSGLTYPGGWRTAIFFPESKKILADSDHGMYLFDAGNPKSGWREVNYTCNLYERCRLDKAFVIHNYHPDIGHFNLLFSFCVLGDNRAGVAVLFMSDACDFAHPVDHSIELPELERELAPYSHMIPDFKFVYLGAQKFGIVLNYNSTLDPCGPQDNFQVLLLTYEYDTIVNAASTEDNSRPNVDIKSRLLETRVFTYTPLEDYKRRHVDLIGAFSFSVLPYESEEALLSNCPGIDEDEHIKEQNCQLRPGLQDCSEDVCRERVVSYCSRSLFTREFYILLSVNIRIDLCILPATQTIDLTFSPSKRKTPLYSVTPHPPEALFSGTSTFVLFHSIFTWIEKSAPKIQNRALYPASFIRGKIRILDLRRETAAVRLAGANHQISRARFCSSGRRSSSTFTAAAASDRVSKPAEPILYLCFKEIIKSANYVVRRVGLKDGEDDAPAEVATVEAYKAFENDMMEFSDTKCPTTLGSQIIIPVNSGKGCREICWTDTAKRPMKLQVSSDDHCSLWKLRDEIKMGEVKYVSLPKYDIRDVKIGVMGGELYSLDMYNKQLFKMYPSFNELLDPCFNQFVVVNSKSDIVSSYRKVFSEDLGFLDAIFFSESKKILARSKYNGTYCFDASNPKNGWREVNYQFLKCFSSKQALVIHNYHPDIGHFNLVFYTPIRETIEDFYEDPLFVKVLFVSDACDFARPIEHFIELPKQYLHYPSHLKNIFVHLGAQKFGIIFHDNKLAVDSNNKRGNGDVFLLTYEYDTIVDPPSAEDKSRPNVDIKTRLLEIRVFTYQTIEKLRSADYGEVDLIGASFIRQSSI